MKITTTEFEKYVLLEVAGSLTVEERLQFENYIIQYREKPFHVIIDFSDVTFIDSSTLGMIMKFYTEFQKDNRYLLLININQQIYQVFSMTGINSRIRIFSSLGDAVKFLQNN